MELQPIPANYTSSDHPDETQDFPSELNFPRPSTRTSNLYQPTILPQTLHT
ncbi:hypothetical protein DPMN_013864 [Dreissena polymorpha]|uniref:Uncharacterized protein n=1 Tax=Dreissena polymorpha TaxID=45954 RepID=A0A9D4S419_DREPO|nr:hypothetical protein DPMN_013864 [Dreissena polymorpha]